MKPLGKTQLLLDKRAEEIAAAKAVIEARIRLAQIGVTPRGRGRRVAPDFVLQDKTLDTDTTPGA